jgi:tetratricopeptide (TPR) repeat protein
MGQPRRSILVAAVAIVACVAAPAAAGPRASDREKALKHFDQAQAFFLAKAYDKAAVEYQAAYDLVPKPGLLFNIGLCRENQGDSTGAIEIYQRYLAADPRGTKSVEARARLAALEEKLASEREAARRAEVEKAQRAEEARQAARARQERRRREALEEKERARQAERDRPRLLPGLLVLGGAVGAGAFGVAYQLRARSIRQDLDRELENGTPPLDSNDPRFDEGRSAAGRASLAYGIAGVAGAVGAVLTVRALLARRSEHRAVSLRPTGAGLSVEVFW